MPGGVYLPVHRPVSAGIFHSHSTRFSSFGADATIMATLWQMRLYGAWKLLPLLPWALLVFKAFCPTRYCLNWFSLLPRVRIFRRALLSRRAEAGAGLMRGEL